MKLSEVMILYSLMLATGMVVKYAPPMVIVVMAGAAMLLAFGISLAGK